MARTSRAIATIRAQEILDSRGRPTIEAVATLESGASGLAQVPSGASTGSFEAIELRDGDKQRYDGKGVLQAVQHVEDGVGPGLAGNGCPRPRGVRSRMLDLDGTPNKS
ncbi:MAG: phosphopyruvate hydratase, partial [Oscillatoriales cyanobacterium SM2_1_8]|nr:phosphopyruvate hydratase [Oscillatoriales cyanobacterium SM2_1_8]